MYDNLPNILLITIDALRANHLGCYGYLRNTSPHIDELAKNSYIFENAFSVGPNTPHSFPAIMSSAYPLAKGSFGIKNCPITLAELLRKNGYATCAFNAANPWISRHFGYDRGFDVFEDFEELYQGDAAGFTKIAEEKGNKGINHKRGWKEWLRKEVFGKRKFLENLVYSRRYVYELFRWPRDFFDPPPISRKEVLRQQFHKTIINWFKNVSSFPFFVWIHYMDVHDPYAPSITWQKHLGKILSNFRRNRLMRWSRYGPGIPKGRKRDDLIHLYDSEIVGVDYKIGQIIQSLKNKDLYSNSVIILTSDHGEEFLEHGNYDHRSKLYQELLKVPLIVRTPGQRKRRIVHTCVSLLDIIPTLVELMELQTENGHKSWLCGNGFPIFSSNPSSKLEVPRFLYSEAAYDDNESIFHLNPQNLTTENKRYAVMHSRWKLIWDHATEEVQLYDLKDDPAEKTDVSKDKPRVVSLLMEALRNHIERQERSFLEQRVKKINLTLKEVI